MPEQTFDLTDTPNRISADRGARGVYYARWIDHPWIDDEDINHVAFDQMCDDALARGARKEIMLCAGCHRTSTRPPDEPCYDCGGYTPDMVPYGPEQIVVGEVRRTLDKR